MTYVPLGGVTVGVCILGATLVQWWPGTLSRRSGMPGNSRSAMCRPSSCEQRQPSSTSGERGMVNGRETRMVLEG
ncbi:hypothetical protein E2651_02445 [Streptomyces sp. MZ04]|nr:hypothetical protein E2651_02445 [Streptomyces sp. MZ04]